MADTQPSVPRVRTRSLWSRWLRKLEGAQWVPALLATVAGWYMRLVHATSTVVFEPENPFEMYRAYLPGIGTLWHGNQFLIASIRPTDVPVRILISNHRDGEVTARVAAKFGAGTVRGSGGGTRRWLSKGGVTGFLALRDSLEEGFTVILTADNSRGPARKAGAGIVALARTSGRGIVGIGLAARPGIVINSWDRTIVPLPFARIAVVAVAPVLVPQDASDALLEEKRRELEDGLNAATDRARQIVDQRGR
jgi:lysophospholipid acyltransferase (LPLAT)-like uncharacterized protein